MESTNEIQKWQVAEIQLVYKTKVKPSDRPKISTSLQAYEVLMKNWDDTRIELQEQFKVLLLNRANKILGIVEISAGGIDSTVSDPKLIMIAALKSKASGFILAHNHPSGNLTASQSDLDLTRRLKEAGKFLEIQLLDHIILTTEGYTSCADEGLI